MRQFTNTPPGEDELRRLILPLGQPKMVGRNEVLARRGDPPEAVWLVQHGWAVARGVRQSARAPILRVYLPGDMIGLTELALAQQPCDLITLTEGLVHMVPRHAIAAVGRHSPRCWPLILALTTDELARAQIRATLFDRAVAEDRLIHFLLDMRGRLAVEGIGDGNRFPLPMNQQEIGEATGMTGIYVNRLLGRLVRDGRIEVQRPYVRLLDRPYLESRIGFVDPAPRTDIGWTARP